MNQTEVSTAGGLPLDDGLETVSSHLEMEASYEMNSLRLKSSGDIKSPSWETHQRMTGSRWNL